jgi:hypothetical protein
MFDPHIAEGLSASYELRLGGDRFGRGLIPLKTVSPTVWLQTPNPSLFSRVSLLTVRIVKYNRWVTIIAIFTWKEGVGR